MVLQIIAIIILFCFILTVYSQSFIWRKITDQGPSARAYMAMAYSDKQKKVILFGGYFFKDPEEFFGDTWEWDGSRWRLVSNSGPQPRYGHVMAYDSMRERMVLFGGNNGKDFHTGALTDYGDTWEWDGTQWTEITDQGPEPREFSAMAYDRKNNKVILFGGFQRYGYDSKLFGDTWEWDGISWKKITDLGPGQRYKHAMVYDSRREKVVLFGGRYSGGRDYGDTWEWDGAAWGKKSESGPSPRFDHAMSYDSDRGRVVLFGGGYDVNPAWEYVLQDPYVWEWDGITWTKINITGPSIRYGHSMVYDSFRKVIVLFGGGFIGSELNPLDLIYYSDTWEYGPEASSAQEWEKY